MEEKLTFRTKMGLWSSSSPTQWVVIIAFTAMTIWQDNIAYFLGIAFVLLLLWARRWDWSYIGLTKPMSWGRVWLQAIVLSILLLVVVDLILTPMVEVFSGEEVDLSDFDGLRGNFVSYIIFIVFMWVVAAFGEEFVYRGLMVRRLGFLLGDNKSGLWMAVIFSSILFGIAHRYQGLSGMISTGTVGFIMGAIFINSKNRLWLTILTHGVYDVIGITLIYLDMDKQAYGLLKNLIMQ
jgi:membrane protease YdiL (CAAX protease family)